MQQYRVQGRMAEHRLDSVFGRRIVLMDCFDVADDGLEHTWFQPEIKKDPLQGSGSWYFVKKIRRFLNEKGRNNNRAWSIGWRS